MREYLIHPAGEAAWIPVRHEELTRVLTPDGWDATVVAGWGDHRLRVGEIEVSFSGEDVGWQMSTEGEMESTRADALAHAVADQVATYSGKQTAWVCIQK